MPPWKLAETNYGEVKQRDYEVAVLPFGATEPHNLHLPYSMDTIEGNLVGEIELPLALGLVGGATKTHPIAKIAVKIMGVKSTKEMAEVVASVGLAQNFAALRALATEGIQRGHMRLHSRNIAVTAGAHGDMIDKVSQRMVEEKNITVARAKEILEEISKK